MSSPLLTIVYHNARHTNTKKYWEIAAGFSDSPLFPQSPVTNIEIKTILNLLWLIIRSIPDVCKIHAIWMSRILRIYFACQEIWWIYITRIFISKHVGVYLAVPDEPMRVRITEVKGRRLHHQRNIGNFNTSKDFLFCVL